jgi:hypothetical protein
MKRGGSSKKITLSRRQYKNHRRTLTAQDDAIGLACGMSFNLSNELRIMQTLKNKCIDEIAQYADVIAKTNATNVEFLQQQLQYITVLREDLRDPNKRKLLNLTSYGNMAYIAIHAPPPYNSITREYFDLMMTYL